MSNIIIVGASGFGREVAWVCTRAGLKVAGFCDDAPDKQAGDFCDLPLLGTIEKAVPRLGSGTRFHVAVGDNQARKRLAERALLAGWSPLSVVDPSATCAPDAEIGAGSYVGIGSVVSSGCKLGRFAIVNFHATVGHDSVVSDYAQLCPGVRLSGGCTLREGAFLGSNAVVVPLRRVGKWSRVGAGTVAMKDLADGETVMRVR
ncbi:MAG: acetyltransferase [Kiritimatiellae bacterium]|nr:acetyltransferase [Kiritimatiellia bacterium]